MTRNEWQQQFNKDTQSASTSHDKPSEVTLPVILRKSLKSQQRARRWVSGTFAASNAPEDSASTQSTNAAHHTPVSISNGPTALLSTTLQDSQHLSVDFADTLNVLESLPIEFQDSYSNIFASYDLPESPTQAFFAAPNGLPPSMSFSHSQFHALPCLVAPGFRSPILESDTFDSDVLSLMDMPARNNMTFMLQDATWRQELPFAKLEHDLRSKGVILRKTFGGPNSSDFASKYIAPMLLSKNNSVAVRSGDVQLFLRNLGSLIPGESSALITDSQAFETNFARTLIFSILNGFAGLDSVPMEEILRFLNRFVVNKLLLDILEQSPRHVSRTLADNIFRAAIEATDANVVELLLGRRLVDVNEIVCFHNGKKYTPIQRATALGSLNLIRSLIGRDADVNKSHDDSGLWFPLNQGALVMLVTGIADNFGSEGGQWAVLSELVEACNMLTAAGARVDPGLIHLFAMEFQRMDLVPLIIEHMHPEDHRELFEASKSPIKPGHLLVDIAMHMDDSCATKWFRDMFGHCNQLCGNKCLLSCNEIMRITAHHAASKGMFGLIRLLVEEARVDPRLPEIFTAAVASQNFDLIDFILRYGPDLDPPAALIFPGCGLSSGHHTDNTGATHPAYRQYYTTPIAEAVRYGNEGLIRRFEAEGSLDRLAEGGRFCPLVQAAAEAGNVAYVRKLLLLPIDLMLAPEKQVFNQNTNPGNAIILAARGGHREIVQMLLEAGAGHSIQKFGGRVGSDPFSEAVHHQDVQMLRALIEFEGPTSSFLMGPLVLMRALAVADRSILDALVQEYPLIELEDDSIRTLLTQCIKRDTLDLFKGLLQLSSNSSALLDECLKAAVEFSHIDLIAYLVDMGANPFNAQVLKIAMPNRPDLLRLLLKQERRQQTMPTCIGAIVLESVIGDGAGNSEALDLLLRTQAINFTRLEFFESDRGQRVLRRVYALTPLGLAIQGSPERPGTNIAAMEKFLKVGADPNGIAKLNNESSSPLMTALMVAIGTGREDAVKMLLRYGAKVNGRPRIRTTRTALQYAADIGSAAMVHLLLNHCADANAAPPPSGGATALQFAAISGNCNMAAELLDRGAQLGAFPSKIHGRWPLEGAAESGRLDMISFLWNLYEVSGRSCAGFSERQCLRAMNFARVEGHIGCADLISELSGISLDKLETERYGEPWMAYYEPWMARGAYET